MSQVYWGNSFKINRGLAVGFNASYVFGPITQTEAAASNDNFTGYELENKRIVQSFYSDYGLQYSIRNDDWFYTIGLIYGASKKLNLTDDREFTYNGITTSLEQNGQLDVKIPQKFGAGISVKKATNFRAGFDFEWKNWSTIRFSNPNLDTRNSTRFSLGVEYSPGQNNNWLKRLFYRLGANYKNSYLEIDNTPINSKGINLGVGIPNGETSIFNVSMEYGEEGTLSKRLIKSSYWLVYLNFSLQQIWAPRSRH